VDAVELAFEDVVDDEGGAVVVVVVVVGDDRAGDNIGMSEENMSKKNYKMVEQKEESRDVKLYGYPIEYNKNNKFHFSPLLSPCFLSPPSLRGPYPSHISQLLTSSPSRNPRMSSVAWPTMEAGLAGFFSFSLH